MFGSSLSALATGLETAEIIHWIALVIMAGVYTTRILWLLKHTKAKDRSAPGGGGRTSARESAKNSLFNVVMPNSMESTRTHKFFYGTFVLFHLGVVAGISLAFISTLWRGFVENTFIAIVFGTLMAGAFVVGVGRLIRRVIVPHMRLISTPDDFFSLAMLTCWFLLGTITQITIAGSGGDGALIAYLYLTSFFLLYVPFSKISHYLYYPFTRWWIGKALGHRGSMPIFKG